MSIVLLSSISSLQIRLDIFLLPSKLSSTTQECHHFTLAAYSFKRLINIATCCEGHKIKMLANNSLFFRIATSQCGWFLSFHITMLQPANISHQEQPFRAVLTSEAVLSTTCGGSTLFSFCFEMFNRGRPPEMHLTLMWIPGLCQWWMHDQMS